MLQRIFKRYLYLTAILTTAILWLPLSSAMAECRVNSHESSLFELIDLIYDLTDATVRAEDSYARLVQSADPGSERTSVVVNDLENFNDDVFSAWSILDLNKLGHQLRLEQEEREVMESCIDDQYRAQRVAASCVREQQAYRQVIRSVAFLTENLIIAIGNVNSATGTLIINASTLWPTLEIRTDVRNEDLNKLDKLLREANAIRRKLEREVRSERRPRKALYNCTSQMPEYYESSEDSGNPPLTPADKVDGIASISKSQDEGSSYDASGEVLGDQDQKNALSETTVYKEQASLKPDSEHGESDAGRKESRKPEVVTGLSEEWQHYDKTLSELDNVLNVLSGSNDQIVILENSDYESKLEALDRRRARYEAELRQRASAKERNTRNISPSADAQSAEEKNNTHPQMVADSGTQTKSSEQDDRCRITCRQGSICVEYTLDKASDCQEFSSQCQNNPEVTFDRGHTCGPGVGCRQIAPQRVSITYDPMIEPDRFKQLCVENNGEPVTKAP